MEKKLRKYESNLIVSAFATMLFAVWSVAKSLLNLLVLPESAEEIEALNIIMSSGILIAFVVSVVLIFLSIDIGLRIYIAMSADAEGKNRKKKSWLYIVLAILLAAGSAQGIVSTWLTFDGFGIVTAVISSMIDIGSLCALIDLIVSAINVKRLRKALAA